MRQLDRLKHPHWIASLASFFAVTSLLFISFVAHATMESPLPMMERTANQMLRELKQDQQKIKQQPDFVHQLVRRVLLPHVDLPMMARMVLGRDMWAKASPRERQEFTEEFTTLLLRTYASALSAYNDQQVEFFPIRGGVDNKVRVQVESKIVRKDGPPIPLNYRLLHQGKEWKVYDFTVEGVSMIESFRSQFAEQLSQGGGMTALLNTLKEHNRMRKK
ncbi:MAG: MlaC/ttg2D family ABC transporter substrate-binding protein [Gammaproteobacteria bacterium]